MIVDKNDNLNYIEYLKRHSSEPYWQDILNTHYNRLG